MLKVVIDAGNTSTTLALFDSDGARILRKVPIRGGIVKDYDICDKVLREVANGVELSGAMLASVTPLANDLWTKLVRDTLGCELRILSHTMKLPFVLDIPAPESMGADRIADMVAAVVLYGKPAIVVDIGTAVTYDLCSDDGRFFTGVIAPGPELMAHSLNDYTALLPFVDWWKEEPSGAPSNTEEAIRSGLYFGFRGMTSGIVSHLKTLVKDNAHFIATGGFAARLISDPSFVVDPDLTLRGIGILSSL